MTQNHQNESEEDGMDLAIAVGIFILCVLIGSLVYQVMKFLFS